MLFKYFLLHVLIASSLSTSFSPILAGVLADYLHFGVQTIYERNLCPEELTIQIWLAFRRLLVLFVKQPLHLGPFLSCFYQLFHRIFTFAGKTFETGREVIVAPDCDFSAGSQG